MSTTSISPNIFGDHIPPVDNRALAQRIKSLNGIFADVLKDQASLSGYFEIMLREMSSETKTVLFLKLARWLRNQPEEVLGELDALYADGTLLEVFETVLSGWAQEMMTYTDKGTVTNLFGDTLSSTDKAALSTRVQSLGKIFAQVLKDQANVSGYFETMLGEMSSEAKTVLFLKLGRWLKNQADVFLDELEALHADDKLLNVFETALADWAQEMTLTNVARKSRIQEVYATQLFPALRSISVPVGVIHEESHHANHTDMVYVCGMASAVNARRIFEFGTYRGQTTCGMASVCKDAQVFTLNLPPEADPRYAPYIGMYIARSPDRERITQLFCDARTFDTTPYRESMDYIFIDGDHSYQGVRNDTEKALQLLKPGGVIVWHDYAAKSPGVLEYLAEFSRERPLFRLRKTCLAVYVDGVNPETAELAAMDASLEEEEYGDGPAR